MRSRGAFWSLASLAVGLAVLLSACANVALLSSEEPKPLDQAQKLHKAATACDLLSEDEAALLLGAGASAHRTEDVIGSDVVTTCAFTTSDGDAITILRRELAKPEDATNAFEARVRSATGGEPVAGAGDAALLVPAERQVLVRKGTTLVTITAATLSEAQLCDLARSLGLGGV